MTVYEYATRPRATYKGKVHDKYSDSVHLFFEYRGHEYMITDEHNGYSVPMHKKHQDEQNRIDMLIEESQKTPTNSNNEFNMNELYSIMGWD
jgi:hypothetical protein